MGSMVLSTRRRRATHLAIFGALLFGLVAPGLATEAEWKALNAQVDALSKQGNYAQAESLARQALRVAEETFGPDHLGVAVSLEGLASLYSTQRQFAKAEPFYQRSLALREKVSGADHPDVAMILERLAIVYEDQEQYAQAEPLYKRALAIREKTRGPDHPDVATNLNSLASLHTVQGRYTQAEELYKRALAIREKARGPDHHEVAGSLNLLASLYRHQGQYAQAEPLFKRALAIRERTLGPEHRLVAQSLNNLALLYKKQGKYGQAEPLYKHALAIREKVRGADHPEVAESLNNLAMLYQDQGQYAQAEPLLKRSLAVWERAHGPDHPNVGVSLGNLAAMHAEQKRYAQAVPLYERSLTILEKSGSRGQLKLAATLNSFALLHMDQAQYAPAEPIFKRVLAIREANLGPDHPDVATGLHNLAGLYLETGNYSQAESLSLRSLAIREKAFGSNHPDLAVNLNNLAALHQRQGQYLQAATMARRGSAMFRQRVLAGGADEGVVREAMAYRKGFYRHLAILSSIMSAEQVATRAELADEAFQIGQLAEASGTAGALAKMSARFASGDDALAGLVKRSQDAAERRRRGEAQLVQAASRPPKERDAEAEARLRSEVAQLAKDAESADAELNRRFPEYLVLTRPEPITIRQVQGFLQSGEALLAYALGEDPDSYLYVVSKDRAEFVKISLARKDAETQIATLRGQMEKDGSGRSPKVDVDLLHALYQSLITPALPLLAGASQLMIVPAGPLTSLPFGMLVASPPPKIESDADYRKVDWLAKRYATSVLPAASSLRALREFAKGGGPREPFAGFGDPVIGESRGKEATKGQRVDLAGVFRGLKLKSDQAPPSVTPIMEIADVEAIRNAASLPETAEELRAIAKAMKVGDQSLWLREKATETKVKRLDLTRFRTIAFATHGVMAGEIPGIGEPGLILTPPKEGTLDDDGYLSATEIARLKLNADWVILSACNTAAADGTPGAEGLSGVAKAFVYAGSRSLLVSHWPVDSKATVALTTHMLSGYEAKPGQGKAEAHRQAMLALMNTQERPEYAHPLYWAPFVVVGEGGVAAVAGRR